MGEPFGVCLDGVFGVDLEKGVKRGLRKISITFPDKVENTAFELNTRSVAAESREKVLP